jgi:transposase
MRSNKCEQWERIAESIENAREPMVRHRLSALGAIACGRSVTEVSRWYGVSRQTLYNWMGRLRQGRWRPESLVDEPKTGRPSLWNKKSAITLKEALKLSPMDLGYSSQDWTVDLLRDYLAMTARTAYSEQTVRRQLHRLGYIWKRPRYVLEPDPEGEKKSLCAKTLAGTAGKRSSFVRR